MIKVHPIPALCDNYIWLIILDDQRAIVVDPGEAQPVLDVLAKQGLTLEAILITHGCLDHVGGIVSLLRQHPAPVYGPTADPVPALTNALSEDDQLTFGPLTLTVMEVPGHTRGHIAFHGSGMLFCGDTLFSAGCGRLHNGTFAQLHNSLNKITQLPKNTHVYCAHEYSAANLAFARTVEPDNSAITARQQQVEQLRGLGRPSVPTTLSEEMEFNPFLRCHTKSVRYAAEQNSGRELNDSLAVFTALRQWKNNF